jgi:hypothetical protein
MKHFLKVVCPVCDGRGYEVIDYTEERTYTYDCIWCKGGYLSIPLWIRLWISNNIPYRFYPRYWAYILGKRDEGNDTPWLEVVKCRWLGHPQGEVFYNVNGLEPDHHCRDCGEEIG